MKTLSDIYRHYSPEVYRFALGLSGDPAWAEDITSETFVRAMVSPNPIRNETVKGYLFTIARNLYLQDVKKAQRFVMLDEQMADHEPSPEHTAFNQDELHRVLSNLQKLSEVDRTALLMRAHHELPYSEIAQALNISQTAAKVKVHRARAKLARLMQMALDKEAADHA